MSRFRELMDSGRRHAYWLNKSEPMEDGGYLVCVVFEDEPGCFPTGGGEKDPLKAPWYWTDEVCDQANFELGLTRLMAADIVCSSMSEGRRHPLTR